ncbi:MAG: hypothetical protein V7785_08020 [Bermanella sp.]
MMVFLVFIYKALKEAITLCVVGIIIYGGVAYYDEISGIRVDLQQAASTANENMLLVVETVQLTFDKMDSEISSLKELSGFKKLERSQSKMEFAHKILDLIQKQDAVVGTDGLIGSEIDDPISARKWAASARDEARIISFRARDHNEIVWALSTTITKQDWLIQFGESEPIPIYDWISNQSTVGGIVIRDKEAGRSEVEPVL